MSQSTLATAIVAAQASARDVEKDARNAFMRYNYASAEAIIAEAKSALAGAGLAVLPVASSLEYSADLYASQGIGATLHCTWRLVHTSGEHMDLTCSWPVVPEKGRPPDKATAAARTASLGYMLRDLLQLPRVEEGTGLDDDSRDAQGARGAPPKAPPKSAPPKAPPKDAPKAGPKAGVDGLRLLAQCGRRVVPARTPGEVDTVMGDIAHDIAALPPAMAAGLRTYSEARKKELMGVELTKEEARVVEKMDSMLEVAQ